MTLSKLVRLMDGAHPDRALDWLVDQGVVADSDGRLSVNDSALRKLLTGARRDDAQAVRDFIGGAIEACN